MKWVVPAFTGIFVDLDHKVIPMKVETYEMPGNLFSGTMTIKGKAIPATSSRPLIEAFTCALDEQLRQADTPFPPTEDVTFKDAYGTKDFGSNVSNLSVTRILKSGPYTHVFWSDGTKTSVRRSPDEEDNDYAAFTAALAIKMYGSNSALKRMLKEKVEVQKPKEKKSTECTDTCPIDYDAIYRELSAKIEHLENGDAT